jgi:C4-type Zn-finger protein
MRCLVCGEELSKQNVHREEYWGTPVVAEYSCECSCGYRHSYTHGIIEHAFRKSRSFVTTYENDHKPKLRDHLKLLIWRLIRLCKQKEKKS